MADALKDNPAVVPGQHIDLSDDAMTHWRRDAGLVPFFETLMQERLWVDAIKVMPHLMDKRRAVWWGCLCCWSVDRPEPKPANAKALSVSVAWVCNPSEPNREAARQAGEAAGMDEAAGCVATAAFVSSGSLLPANLPVVPPPTHLTGQVLGTAILHAASAAAGEPEATFHEFLELGRAIASGRYPWSLT
jgi:hypothetical protein